MKKEINNTHNVIPSDSIKLDLSKIEHLRYFINKSIYDISTTNYKRKLTHHDHLLDLLKTLEKCLDNYKNDKDTTNAIQAFVDRCLDGIRKSDPSKLFLNDGATLERIDKTQLISTIKASWLNIAHHWWGIGDDETANQDSKAISIPALHKDEDLVLILDSVIRQSLKDKDDNPGPYIEEIFYSLGYIGPEDRDKIAKDRNKTADCDKASLDYYFGNIGKFSEMLGFFDVIFTFIPYRYVKCGKDEIERIGNMSSDDAYDALAADDEHQAKEKQKAQEEQERKEKMTNADLVKEIEEHDKLIDELIETYGKKFNITKNPLKKLNEYHKTEELEERIAYQKKDINYLLCVGTKSSTSDQKSSAHKDGSKLKTDKNSSKTQDASKPALVKKVTFAETEMTQKQDMTQDKAADVSNINANKKQFASNNTKTFVEGVKNLCDILLADANLNRAPIENVQNIMFDTIYEVYDKLTKDIPGTFHDHANTEL